MNIKTLFLGVAMLALMGGGCTAVEDTDTQPTEVEPIERISVEKKIIEKDDAHILLDSTRRVTGVKFVDDPMTREEVQAEQGQYNVSLFHVPECSGSHVGNSYIALIENNDPYDYAVINMKHDLDGTKIQEMFDELPRQDPVCGYVEESPESQPAIDEMLSLYESTYKTQDLERIEELLKEIQE